MNSKARLGSARLGSARPRLGGLEGDTIVGAQHNEALLTRVKRKGLFITISKLVCPMAEAAQVPPCVGWSITYGNGKEFTGHRKTATACPPRSSLPRPIMRGNTA